MFANRFTALIDACVLAGALKRNLILSLAAAEFFRIRWSTRILDETETAIREIRLKQGSATADRDAARARAEMERAFPDAMVEDDERLITAPDLPDAGDLHVLTAAVKTQASVIVTDNIRDFPAAILARYTLFARTADDFIADIVDLDLAKAHGAIEAMRLRFRRPELTPEALLIRMEATSLTATADLLRPHLLA
jgi:predicted nucleic acid-binding protein